MEEEVLKEIEGFPCYAVSNFGNVYSNKKMSDGEYKILKPGISGRDYKRGYGYYFVNIFDSNGKVRNRSIHRLVTTAFIPNPENKPWVNHKDCNKMNNHVSNLEWCTERENYDHAIKNGLFLSGENNPMATLTCEKVKEIRERYSRGNTSYTIMGKEYGIAFQTIGLIVNHKRWKNIP